MSATTITSAAALVLGLFAVVLDADLDPVLTALALLAADPSSAARRLTPTVCIHAEFTSRCGYAS